MRSALPKVLHRLCGRPMLGHVLALADLLAPQRTVVVLSPQTLDQVQAAFGGHYTYVPQAERLGTGHAVLQAREALGGREGQVLVLFGDTPLVRAETAQTLLQAQHAAGSLVGVLSFQSDPPTGYGRIVRNAAGQVEALVEERDATPEQRAITEVNAGVMCFDAGWLWEQIDRIPLNRHKHEYYLTDLVAMAVGQRGPGAVVAVQAADPSEAWGINNRAQLAQAEQELRRRINQVLMESGVTMVDPASTYVDADASVGADTTLLPGTMLRGRTTVGAGCTIGPHAELVDVRVGDQARVSFAVVEGGEIAAGARIGPFEHISNGRKLRG
ncbi:MAG: hypothetical protein OHK0022_51500 [Roseiflexaceae bacterium]